MARRSIGGIAVFLAALLGAFAAVAGPRPVTFYYAPELLAPAEWTQVRRTLYAEFAEDAAKVRAQGDDLLDPEHTTVAKADIDFDGVEELFVMLYGPDVVCFPFEGCLTALLRHDRDGAPWRFDSAPVSIFSDGPPVFYLREEITHSVRDGVAHLRRTFFSAVDPLIEEPGPDERIRFRNGDLTPAEWQALAPQLNSIPGVRVREPRDLDVARTDVHSAAGPEMVLVPREECGVGHLCRAFVASLNGERGWRLAPLAALDDVYVGGDNLPILFLREERRFGWRTGYTSDGAPRARVPFIDWGRYGMRKPMLAEIGVVDMATGAWTGRGDGAKTGAEFLNEEAVAGEGARRLDRRGRRPADRRP